MSARAHQVAVLMLIAWLAPYAASAQHTSAPAAAAHPAPAKPPIGEHSTAVDPKKSAQTQAAPPPAGPHAAAPVEPKKPAHSDAAPSPAAARPTPAEPKGALPATAHGTAAGKNDIKAAFERIDRQIAATRAAGRPERAAAAPVRSAPVRIRLTWRTVLSWPAELTGDGDMPSHDDGRVVTLIWH